MVLLARQSPHPRSGRLVIDDIPLWDYLATAQWNHRHARQNMNWPRVILWRRQTNYLTTRLEDKR